jgi:erythromycin esterase
MVARGRLRRRFDEDDGQLREAVRGLSTRLRDDSDLDPLMDRIGNARYVLLGEASHGTREYYTWRTRITRRLVQEKGFGLIGVEGDWPDCYRVNRYVKAYGGSGTSAYDVLNAFERWPTWMWANREVVHLAEWLRGHNEAAPPDERVGFYGLDVYSLWESIDAVLHFLKKRDPAALTLAKEAYACFEPYGRDEQRYARATARLAPQSCEDEVVSVLAELRRVARESDGDAEASFVAEQNALVAVNAERYYRAMVRADDHSWNIRDIHMADTLDRLVAFTRSRREVAKAIVWAHNTHIGDARATDMADAGMINLGEIVRERHGPEGVVLVGFAGHQGSVIAGSAWGAEMERMNVPPAREGSWEHILHGSGEGDRLLVLGARALRAATDFHRPRGHRAIGVVYHPQRERFGNYVPTDLPARYDALLFFDTTSALHPLHAPADLHEVPETYPSGV